MLSIRHLSIRLDGRALLEDVSLDVAAGEVVTLMGPSGAGKSSLLNWLVGDLDPALQASGEAWLDGRRIDGLPTERRGVGILFQDDLLFPHVSVGRNLAFALPAGTGSARARRARVEEVLADMGLEGFHDRDPASLSGGQRARVAVMRALLAQPAALLLDEPFSRLDTDLRTQFRAFVFDRIRASGMATLLVTHDRADAPAAGRVLQLDGETVREASLADKIR